MSIISYVGIVLVILPTLQCWAYNKKPRGLRYPRGL